RARRANGGSRAALRRVGRAAAAGPAPRARPAHSVTPRSLQQLKERSAMSSGLNREIHLAARPQGWPTLDTFTLVETPIPEPTEGYEAARARSHAQIMRDALAKVNWQEVAKALREE